MPMTADQSQAPTATLVDLGAIFISLELSKSTWLVTVCRLVARRCLATPWREVI